MTDCTISVLLPTRGRAALAARSIDSLADTASDPSRLEIMLGFDLDDAKSAAVARHCQRRGLRYQAWLTPRLGYANLHRYVNKLAALATGSWLMIWNDDVLMESAGWDDILAAEHGFMVLDMLVRNAAPRFQHGLFPIVPSAWRDLLGCLSRNRHNDTYILEVGMRLFRWRPTREIVVFHDRFDETGNNDDATYREREYASDDFFEDVPNKRIIKPAVDKLIRRDVRTLWNAFYG